MVKRRECAFDQLALRIYKPQPWQLVAYWVNLAYACDNCLALQRCRLYCATCCARRCERQFVVVAA